MAMTPDVDSPVLKVILFADLADYSRLTAAGEDAAIDLVTRSFRVFMDCCVKYRGELVKSTGDGVLIIFDSVSDALAYALEVQSELAEASETAPAVGRFRIGLHLGEVHRRAGDIYGHAVNVAARLQAMAIPGGVCATQEVCQAARSASRFAFRFAGRQPLKNMPESVAIYHVTRIDGLQSAAAPEQLSISVIDGLAVFDARGEPVTIRSRTVQALIGYLSLTTGFRDLKDRIAALLWPENAPTGAHAALNSCMRIAGKALGLDGASLRRGGYISLDPARVTVDVQRVLVDLGEGKIDDALMQRPDWPEAILHGFESMNSLYGTWVRVTRQNRRDRAQEALEDLLERFDSSEPIVKHAANALLALEPSHEGAVRSLMRHYAANHNAAAGLRAYENLCRMLSEQYGLEPSTETTALMASLSGLARAPTPRREARAPVIVIGAFTAASEAIAARVSGFRAELIVNLSRFRELTIVDSEEPIASSGVDYVLSTECRQADAEITLFAVLKAAAARRVVWSDSCQLSLDTWMNVQRQLVGRIASNVEIYLSHDRLSRAIQRTPDDLDVYDAWLRGEHLLQNWSANSEDEAEKLFQQAIAEDANFAPAYASLASVYNSRQFIRPGLPRRPGDEKRALELASRAVELDPLDARNLMAVAWSAAMAQSFEQAELYFDLASELNPNDPKILVSASLGLAFMGRIDLAGKLLDHATALTTILPAYQWSHIATIRFLAGAHAGAVEAADRSRNVIIDTPGWKAAALGKLGRNEERHAALNQLLRAVEAVWAGSPSPSHDDIIAWFVGVFPIRHDSVRQDLAASLRCG